MGLKGKTDKLSLQRLGLPESLDKIDGAMRWGYNDKTYFFSGSLIKLGISFLSNFIIGTMYWRFDEDIQYVELDYPRDIQMWRDIPYKIDAVFQWHDRNTYFFKDKYFWQFDDKKMESTEKSPKLIGEFWLQCPREMQDPYKKAASSSPCQTANYILFLTFLIFSHTSYFYHSFSFQ